MLWRVRNSRGRLKNAPAAFIEPCRPTVSQRPPRGSGWAHELKHDGYRLQIHVRDGRVRLFTVNGADCSKLDTEVVWIGPDGVADFDALHSRVNDQSAIACAFDLLLDGDDLRHKSFVERGLLCPCALRKVLRVKGGIQYVEHTEGDGAEMFEALCKLGLEGIISKGLDTPYRSGPSKSWIKVKNPKAPAATRIIEG
jgi:bifunctional non-homologous end joining protein LigD